MLILQTIQPVRKQDTRILWSKGGRSRWTSFQSDVFHYFKRRCGSRNSTPEFLNRTLVRAEAVGWRNLSFRMAHRGFAAFASFGDKVEQQFLLIFNPVSGFWKKGRSKGEWVITLGWGKYAQGHVLTFAREICSFRWTSMCLTVRKSPS